MTRLRWVTALAAALATAGCGDLLVPDYNNPSLEELERNPTPAAVAAAATGLLVGGRDEFDDRNGYVSLLGILGRESYNFDGADPRFITEMLEGSLNPSSPAFGGNLWAERYRNIRTGTTILNALGRVGAYSDEQKRATAGFVKTIQAHELLLIINTRDMNGAVIEFDREPTAEPGPLVGRDAVLARVASLLDEAKGDLDQGGSAFPFPLSSGFAGFDTPVTFARFNRALKARVEAYRANWAEVLTALQGSFLTVDPAALDLGVYHAFGTGSGDDQNELYDPGDSPDILAHPAIVADAEQRANGEPDLRVQRKIRTLPATRTVRSITTGVAFTIYDGLSAPIPIIRNEELILLRAEAHIGLNNAALALDDLNFIRTNSGGLPPLLLPTQATVTELLRQRRYSLMFEGGHRWIDVRRYNRMSDLPLDRPNHQLNAAFPVPEAECLARGLQTCSA
ncbi:MAG TPA: RagB/SusD family nutrient uptake outer membrane protein [Longimicrobiales bacterium]